MLELATGWLGWSEEQVLSCRLATLEMACKGRMDMVKAIIGEADESSPSGQPHPPGQPPLPKANPKMIIAAFKSMAIRDKRKMERKEAAEASARSAAEAARKRREKMQADDARTSPRI